MSRDRVLVVDADISKRVAAELRKRGRNATSVYTMNIAGLLDPELLQELVDRYGSDWVLATANDRMPYQHALAVEATTGAIATVDPRRPSELNMDKWRRDIVHKWADRMQKQSAGSVYRYSMESRGRWRARAHYLLSHD